jgi:hypothetical protein
VVRPVVWRPPVQSSSAEQAVIKAEVKVRRDLYRAASSSKCPWSLCSRSPDGRRATSRRVLQRLVR